jgi:23S rRNA (cytidine1920-2'-O)/16S rRNA (cytidine1409-2'-O)-methyltransferase
MAKVRADQQLLAQGLAETRARAQALIIGGKVLLGDKRIDKPGQQLPEGSVLKLKEKDHPWVSRGGLKLDHALGHFIWDIQDTVVVDVGSSTGGFTHVALSKGAAHVYAVDVGHGQLDWRLRNDERVTVLEKTNARYLTADQIPTEPTLIVCDASFISLKSVLPASMALLCPGGRMVALIKPQFEVGKGEVGKGGVVRDPAQHEAVCADISAWLAEDLGWRVEGVETSPITGPKGNVEFLIAAHKPGL